jgi:hypothetical protein
VILNVHLLVQHLFVVVLVLSFGMLLVLHHLSIVSCLEHGLVFVELCLVVEIAQILLFFLLHVKLHVIQPLGLILLLVNEALLLVEPSLNFLVVIHLPFLFSHQLRLVWILHLSLVVLLHVFLVVLHPFLVLHLLRVVRAYS